jgi:small conductance mechanosensitive channel
VAAGVPGQPYGHDGSPRRPADAIARYQAALSKIPTVARNRPTEVTLLDVGSRGPVLANRPCAHDDHDRQVSFDTNEMMVRVAKEAGCPAPMPAQVTRIVQG